MSKCSYIVTTYIQMKKQKHEHLRWEFNCRIYGVHICKHCGEAYCGDGFCDPKKIQKGYGK